MDGRHDGGSMSRKSKVIVGAGAFTALLLAGVAFAAWTGTGTGPGRARATTAVAVTVTASDGTADLYPGFTGGDLYFTLTNPNPYTITFASMTPGAVTVTGGAGCLPTHITVAPATGLSLVSPPGTSGQLSILDVVTMVAGAPDACQAATFNVTLTLTGTQT
jgi:hypothetical protein